MSDSECWLRLQQTKRPNTSISFASVMQVANGDPVKLTIEGARFRRFKADALTRSWHGTMRGIGDM